jgi:hypothetical protein
MRPPLDGDAPSKALILIPGSMNYFYNLSGRRIAEALEELGVVADVATLTDCAVDDYDWCVLSNVSEVVASFGDEAAALSKLRLIRERTRSMASAAMDCAQTQWFQRVCVLSRKVGADCLLDLGVHPQSHLPDAQEGLAYRFLFSGLTPSELIRFDQLDDGSVNRHIPWAFVGHITESRVALVDHLVHNVHPSGFVYIPSLAPYTETDSPHLNQQEFERVLEHTRFQVWRSHHEYFYLEPERFRSSLLTGGVPIKVVDAKQETPDGAPFGYLTMPIEDLATRLTASTFDAMLARFRADWKRLPTLAQGLRTVLDDAGIPIAQHEGVAA